MIINGSLASNKTDLLIEQYLELLNKGIDASEILVIVSNSTQKKIFQDKTLEKLKLFSINKLQIHSFFSLIYNTISDNWAFLEERNIYDNPVILPNLAGLEVSQYIMKNILKSVQFKGYNSRLSLLHQIFRRYSLIVLNNLSQSEIDERAKILKEGFSEDANLAIKKFLRKTLELRDFDYLRQCLLFNFIYKNTDYFKNIKYLIVDDADELTPICIDFIEYLSKQLKEHYIAIDENGSSRCGYLSADKNNYTKIQDIFKNSEIINLDNEVQNKDSTIIFENVKLDKQHVLENFKYKSYSKRPQMIEVAITQIKALLKSNIKSSDIVVISPIIDDMLKFSLKESFNQQINLKYLSGSEKLSQNRLVKATLTILKLNTELKYNLTEFDLRIILSDFLHIPLKYCEEILTTFTQNRNLITYNFNDEEYNKNYSNFIKLIADLSISEEKISDQIYKIYNQLFNISNVDSSEYTKFNFFIKQITDFENIFGANFNKHKNDIIIQIENSIIAENPYSTIDISDNDLIVSTPQKIIDNKIKSKYQIWLDISSSEWIKSDTGPLYNAWVFQKDWTKNEYTIEDNLNLAKDKNARVLRKLTLCANDNIYCYSSLFDSNGIENYGGIENCIITNTEKMDVGTKDNTFKITPREDQKPVLEYNSGYMAISAVPGAGKTTILLALIIKLLNNKIPPEKIFVLTYMDSAARNFRERIKNINTNTSKLPNISTIHGLALRILKENGNYEKVGLSGDFEICDDSQKTRILKELSNKLKIEQNIIEEFNRAISTFKMNKCKFPEKIEDQKINNFKQYYLEYQQSLKDFNLIDYDDMLISSVKVLEENPDVLEYYQNLCEYIIEDEAQDSSFIQQKLIGLLAGKQKNIVRCGDVNQAITSTFSNSDVEGFRKFITDNYNVSMNCSQRCTKDVWQLANNLVANALIEEDSKNSFFKMFMAPVEGKNPKPENNQQCVIPTIFNSPIDEKNYVLSTIKKELEKNPESTIGILVRNNSQVGYWQSLIENSGLKVITRNECLAQKSIFRIIFAILNIILKPYNNDNLADNYKKLADAGLYSRGYEDDISKYENSFISLNPDLINNTNLEKFYWDLNYWVSLCSLSPDEIILKIGLQLFSNDIEKSNIYLLSTLVKRIGIKNNSLDYIVERLSELSNKPNLSGFKFFSEEDEEDSSFLKGKVQIMTMHKSKGDEFNVVIIPQLSEFSLPLSISSINLKSSDFIEGIKSFNQNYKRKTDYELKQEILSENYRLLYVAITRAKNKLYLTASTNDKNRFGKLMKQKVNSIFYKLNLVEENCGGTK